MKLVTQRKSLQILFIITLLLPHTLFFIPSGAQKGRWKGVGENGMRGWEDVLCLHVTSLTTFIVLHSWFPGDGIRS